MLLENFLKYILIAEYLLNTFCNSRRHTDLPLSSLESRPHTHSYTNLRSVCTCVHYTTVSICTPTSSAYHHVATCTDTNWYTAYVHVLCLFAGRVALFVQPRGVVCHAPQVTGFSRRDYWSGFPWPPPGGLPNPGIERWWFMWILYRLSHQGSPRILEWAAIPFYRESSPPRDWAQVSCITGRFFTIWVAGKAHMHIYYVCKVVCVCVCVCVCFYIYILNNKLLSVYTYIHYNTIFKYSIHTIWYICSVL